MPYDPINVAEICYDSQISLELVWVFLPYFVALMSVPLPYNIRPKNFLYINVEFLVDILDVCSNSRHQQKGTYNSIIPKRQGTTFTDSKTCSSNSPFFLVLN